MKHRNRLLLVSSLALSLALVSESLALTVSDNNLQVISLGSLTNTTTLQVSTNFTVSANRYIGVKSPVTMLQAGGASNYSIDGLSTNATTLVANALVTTFGAFNPPPGSYSGTSILRLPTRSSFTNLYYNLGIAQDGVNGGGSTFGYRFGAVNTTLYKSTDADAGLINKTLGNLVPNARFEDSTFNFFSGPAAYVTDGTAPAGSTVLEIDSPATVGTPLILPVEPNKQYAFDFWYLQSAASDTFVQYGASAPNGRSIPAGNTQLGGAQGAWHEASGTFTASATQNNFFISGFVNTGFVRFDSFFVAELVPEPSTSLLLLTGSWLLIRHRRRSARR